ncbi:hypothetical protein, partial [Tritonibacter mobilis]|uniref:hypothetical protein n=1 Tax=Tritonibacter mobilis TaxID=379347 RepID=UPI00195512F7
TQGKAERSDINGKNLCSDVRKLDDRSQHPLLPLPVSHKATCCFPQRTLARSTLLSPAQSVVVNVPSLRAGVGSVEPQMTHIGTRVHVFRRLYPMSFVLVCNGWKLRRLLDPSVAGNQPIKVALHDLNSLPRPATTIAQPHL